jgi:MFS family permease
VSAEQFFQATLPNVTSADILPASSRKRCGNLRCKSNSLCPDELRAVSLHPPFTHTQSSRFVAIEMVTAMFCYIPVAHLADKYGRRPFVMMTFVFFTLFPLTLLWADNFAWLALAFAVRGLKEFGEPARKALIIGEASPEIRARTSGAYYLIRDCVLTTSFLGAWLWSISPRTNFTGAAVCGAIGTLWFFWFVFGSQHRAGK